MLTRIEVELRDGRHRVRQREGLLRAQRLHGPDDRCRLGLLATTGLLLGGDEVEIEIVLGPGARLELSDVAGTVAYHGRGRAASWHTRIEVAPGARLVYRGEPFVVADGAEVDRGLELDLAAGACAAVRETLVLGRSGERGGQVTARTAIRRCGRDLLVEELELGPDTYGLPGLLGDSRVVDVVIRLAEPAPPAPPAETFALLDGDTTITRYLGTSLAASPIVAPAWM